MHPFDGLRFHGDNNEMNKIISFRIGRWVQAQSFKLPVADNEASPVNVVLCLKNNEYISVHAQLEEKN